MDGRTVEDYKQWLLERHSDKRRMVRQALEMGESCSQALKQAIIELAYESKLNALRAEKLYGIVLKDTKDEDSLGEQ